MITHDAHSAAKMAHILSRKVLLGTWAALMVLTLVTVLATRVDFAGPGNLAVAMVIATIKASLVALFFMHLRYDKKVYVIIAATGLLAALLFVSLVVLDGGQYQGDVCVHRDQDCELWEEKASAYREAKP